ncbi:MAG: hypothetical protein M3405_01995 [Acidobacteriota bacterium]|jgi:hypothetical protein|nr:hypothetical protein [Acidobacteriota bacterium]
MKKFNYKYYIRKSHRYLGIFIGIQFIFWTLGGLYFSWTDIDEIHGDLFRKEKAEINFSQDFISPKAVIGKIENSQNAPKIENMRVIEISGSPFYEFAVAGKDKNFIVADAISGEIRENITEQEAKQIAAESLAKPLEVQEIIYLTKDNVGGHHEYREKPLPAWAITYENDLTVYLSAETGQIGAFRTTKWRIFDFLWMLHTMDFLGRDNINNYLLRAFSILGIVTVLSGFSLFFVSSKFIRRRRKWKMDNE